LPFVKIEPYTTGNYETQKYRNAAQRGRNLFMNFSAPGGVHQVFSVGIFDDQRQYNESHKKRRYTSCQIDGHIPGFKKIKNKDYSTICRGN
jgi:hypothetical protein